MNGIRAVSTRGFGKWFAELNPDFLCLQETKAQDSQIPRETMRDDRFLYLNSAQRKGYGGIAVLAPKKPLKITRDIDFARFDSEGRFLRLDYPNFVLINVYMPHGDRTKKNLAYKLEAYRYLLSYLEKIKKQPVVLIGDFNVAREDIDLARPQNNRNNVMFTPDEKKQLNKLLELGFIDSFRKFHPEERQYTWWPYFAHARERNIGWRIDYAFVSRNLEEQIHNTFILGDVLGSDHCPIGIELKV